MEGWGNPSACILDYLKLFQALADEQTDAGGCMERWEGILARERAAPDSAALPPRILRERFRLGRREFLLAMAALALELDGGMRGAFRSRYGLSLPTVEYGLELIAPICPSSVEVLAELAGPNPLTGLLLTTAGQVDYPLERPLILCRAAVTFLTGLALPELRGITVLSPEDSLVPLHREALEQVRAWRRSAPDRTLFLCGPAGCGRRTLLCRACGGAVCLDLEELGAMSPLDRDHLCREAAVLSVLLSVPVCAVALPDRGALRDLEYVRRCFGFPLAAAVEEGDALPRGGESVHLSGALAPGQRERAWRFFVPGSTPDSVPGGAMDIGALRETALLARRSAAGAGRAAVCREDTVRALGRRGGALEFGVRYEAAAALEDMVLPESVWEPIRQICTAARCGPGLAAWGIPNQREGVAAVFHGPSGTGKTMAANAIAGTLGMPLLRADLSQIMDKYVGETEKRLSRLMRCARENRCVLLFDEADALFGKRACVSTGHDKFANLSTSFLLQEMEGYDGVALLSTNLLSNFDDAFLRRLQYVVRFPLPDAALREQLWRRALPSGRLEGEIPFPLLAKAELSPARINAVARAAAVAAMAAGRERVDASGLAGALELELKKDGKSLPKELAGVSSGKSLAHGEGGAFGYPSHNRSGPAEGSPSALPGGV